MTQPMRPPPPHQPGATQPSASANPAGTIIPDPWLLLEVRRELDELCDTAFLAPPALRIATDLDEPVEVSRFFGEPTVWVSPSIAELQSDTRRWLLARALWQLQHRPSRLVRAVHRAVLPYSLGVLELVVVIGLLTWLFGQSHPIPGLGPWLTFGSSWYVPALGLIGYATGRAVLAFLNRRHVLAADIYAQLIGVPLTEEIAANAPTRELLDTWHPWRETPTWDHRLTATRDEGVWRDA